MFRKLLRRAADGFRAVAGAEQEIRTLPFQLVTGRGCQGTAFGGAKGRRDVPKIVDWYRDGKINIDDLITHKLKLDEITKGFELMREGKFKTALESSASRGRCSPDKAAGNARLAAVRRAAWAMWSLESFQG